METIDGDPPFAFERIERAEVYVVVLFHIRRRLIARCHADENGADADRIFLEQRKNITSGDGPLGEAFRLIGFAPAGQS